MRSRGSRRCRARRSTRQRSFWRRRRPRCCTGRVAHAAAETARRTFEEGEVAQSADRGGKARRAAGLGIGVLTAYVNAGLVTSTKRGAKSRWRRQGQRQNGNRREAHADARRPHARRRHQALARQEEARAAEAGLTRAAREPTAFSSWSASSAMTTRRRYPRVGLRLRLVLRAPAARPGGVIVALEARVFPDFPFGSVALHLWVGVRHLEISRKMPGASIASGLTMTCGWSIGP